LQGGKIVHERLIKPGQNVTIGESEKNTFVFKAARIPKRHLLFKSKGDQLSLRFTDEMSGMIALPGGVVPLKDARTNGAAELKGDSYVIPLNQKSRGKVVIGDTTILFQYVAAPPESARLVARQNFRPLLLEEDDPVFLGFLSIWGALGSAVVIYALSSPPVVSVTAEELPELFARLNVDDEEEDEETDSEQVVDDSLDGDEAPTEEADVEEAPVVEETVEVEQTFAAEPEEVQEAVSRDRRLEQAQEQRQNSALFGSRSSDGVIGQTGNGQGSSVSGNYEFSRDQGTRSGSRSGGLPASDGDGITAVDGGPTDLRSGVQGGESSERISATSGSQMAEGTLTASAQNVDDYSESTGQTINRVVRARRGQVLTCYNRELGLNPSARGTLEVYFDILDGLPDPNSIEVDGVSSNMESCVIGTVAGWGFSGVDEAFGVELTYDLTPP